MQNNEISINTDGGSRGNPGPAASAFVVSQNKQVIFKSAKYIGVKTNNYAEYSAVIMALEWLRLSNLSFNLVTFYMDSELAVKQINGVYKVRDENLKQMYLNVRRLLKEINIKIIFVHVRREFNRAPDLLVNQKLDEIWNLLEVIWLSRHELPTVLDYNDYCTVCGVNKFLDSAVK